MARANKGGWDFVEQGKTYQYKEDCLIALVTILEDNSDDDYYRFLLRVEKSNIPPPQNGKFKISHYKHDTIVFSGMLQLYDKEEYLCTYAWVRG